MLSHHKNTSEDEAFSRKKRGKHREVRAEYTHCKIDTNTHWENDMHCITTEGAAALEARACLDERDKQVEERAQFVEHELLLKEKPALSCSDTMAESVNVIPEGNRDVSIDVLGVREF